MRTWLLFGVGICLALALMTLLERPPQRPARTLDVDLDETLTGFSSGPVPLDGPAAAVGAESAPPPSMTAETASVPSSRIVARIVDRARREPAEALKEAMSLEEPALREAAVRAVVDQWSPEYPEAATAHFEALSVYAERIAAAELFARAYAERDPFAALDWVRALNPPVVEPQKPLLEAIEAMAPARAIEIVRETTATEDERAAAVGRLVEIMLEVEVQRVRELADEALALPKTESAEHLLSVLVGDWAGANAVAALEWLVERADELEPGAFMKAGFRVGARDPNAGAAYADRVPLTLRNAWIGAVAFGYANVNPLGAAEWIRRYTGDAAYADAAVAVAEPVALFDGPKAAALLEGVDPELPRYVNTVAGVGGNWARHDPTAAAAWVVRLPTRDARSGALAAVVNEWKTDDEDAALEWVLELPSGFERDRALAPFLSGQGFMVTPRDNRILNAFSNRAAAMRALEGARQARAEQEQRERLERQRAEERALRGR